MPFRAVGGSQGHSGLFRPFRSFRIGWAFDLLAQFGAIQGPFGAMYNIQKVVVKFKLVLT